MNPNTISPPCKPNNPCFLMGRAKVSTEAGRRKRFLLSQANPVRLSRLMKGENGASFSVIQAFLISLAGD